MQSFKSPIIVALDDIDLDKLLSLSESLKDYAHSFKLGLEFFSKFGPKGVEKFTDLGLPIFLDLKLHDIPNTVAKSVTQLCKLNIDMLTIHLSGGASMINAAIEARDAGNKNVKLLGVSVLTSLDDDDLIEIGSRFSSYDQVHNLVNIADKCRLDAVVCSALEVESLKIKFPNIKYVTPGIRLSDGNDFALKKDQKRVMSPKMAISKGSDFLVIGRPITKAENPIETCKNILASIK